MFSRLAILATAALPVLAAATPIIPVLGSDGGQVTGTTACCASTEPASSAAGAAILKAIGVDASDVNVLLGLTCSPISIVGVGSGAACSGTTVACSDGVVKGVGIGCVPVTV